MPDMLWKAVSAAHRIPTKETDDLIIIARLWTLKSVIKGILKLGTRPKEIKIKPKIFWKNSSCCGGGGDTLFFINGTGYQEILQHYLQENKGLWCSPWRHPFLFSIPYQLGIWIQCSQVFPPPTLSLQIFLFCLMSVPQVCVISAYSMFWFLGFVYLIGFLLVGFV